MANATTRNHVYAAWKNSLGVTIEPADVAYKLHSDDIHRMETRALQIWENEGGLQVEIRRGDLRYVVSCFPIRDGYRISL